MPAETTPNHEARLSELLDMAGLDVKNGRICLPTSAKRIKIDVGLSSNAPQSAIWLERDPDLVVLGFEPVAQNVNHLRAGTSSSRTKLNPNLIGQRFFLFPIALGSAPLPTQAKIYVTENDAGCSSILPPRSLPVESEQIVEVWPIAAFLERLPWSHIDFVDHLKTDCQGFDLQVLLGSGPWLKRVHAVTAEPEQRQYLGARNSRREIANLLKCYGFESLRNVRRRRTGCRVTAETDDPTFLNWASLEASGRASLDLYQRF